MVKQVLKQTRERVFEGNQHVVGKILSLFEAATAVICKGKINKDEILERARREKPTRRPKTEGAPAGARRSRPRQAPARS